MKEDIKEIINEQEYSTKVEVVKRMITEYKEADVKLCILGDAVSQEAFEGKLHTDDLEELVKVMVGRNSGAFVYAGIMQNISKEDSISFPELNEFDKMVYEVIGSIYEYGESKISFNQIAKFITQKDKVLTRDGITKEIEVSLTKMLSFLAKLDIKKEAERHKIPVPENIKNGIMIDQLLSGRIISIELNNHECVGGIELRSEPFLFTYVKWKAKGNAQFLRVSPSLFRNKARKTAKRVSLEHYVIERIKRMKHSKRLSRLITYDTLVKRLEPFSNVDTNNSKSVRDMKQKLQKEMEIFLEDLRDKGEIAGCSIDIRKNKLHGWKILLDSDTSEVKK